MHRDPARFAELLEAAASKIETTTKHPGQVVPGVWNIGGVNSPERVIGAVGVKALRDVCADRGLDFDVVMRSYVEVSRNISITPKGGPDVMAKNHLRDAAAELRRIAGGGEPLRHVS